MNESCHTNEWVTLICFEWELPGCGHTCMGYGTRMHVGMSRISHIWMRHVMSHMYGLWYTHTCGYVTYLTHMNSSWYSYEWVTLIGCEWKLPVYGHTCMGGHGTHKHVNEWHIPQWVTQHMNVSESHVGMSHVTRMNHESCHMCESCVMSHVWMSHVDRLRVGGPCVRSHVHELRYTWTRGWVTCPTISHSMHEWESATCGIASCYSYEWVTLKGCKWELPVWDHTCVGHGTHVHVSESRISQYVTVCMNGSQSHVGMSSITRTNESRW